MPGKTKRTADFHIRLTPDEKRHMDELAAECGLGRSELIRLLVQLPADDINGSNIHLVRIDTKTVKRIHTEMRRFGTNFNQAVHALNSINFYLKHGSLRYEYLDIAIPEIRQQLGDVEKQQSALTREVAELQTAMFVS